MIFNSIFPTFYTKENIEIDNEKLKDYCYLQRSIDEGVVLTNDGGWHSSFLKPDIPELQELSNIVRQKLNHVCDVIDFGKQCYIDNCFINISKFDHCHKTHDHPGSFLSVVYYVKASRNQGNLVFQNPNRLLGWFQQPSKIKSYNYYNSLSWTVLCETGLLVIFPAWLQHEVTKNLTQEDRISIVFNCPVEGV